MIGAIREGYKFVRENDIQTVWVTFSRPDVHPLLQFIKYGLCGGLSLATQLIVFYSLAYTILPAMDHMTVNGAPITDELRARNAIIANSIGFIFSNCVAYFSNAIWVFQRGRHHPWLEFGLFTGVALFAHLVALFCGPVLIKLYGIPTHLSQLFFIISAVMVNYVSRKLIIFKG